MNKQHFWRHLVTRAASWATLAAAVLFSAGFVGAAHAQEDPPGRVEDAPLGHGKDQRIGHGRGM